MLNELWVVAEHLGMVGVSFSGSGSMQVGEELKSYLSLFEYYHRKERGGEGGYHCETHSTPPPYPYIEIFHQLPTHFLCFLLLFQETGIIAGLKTST